MGHLLSFIKQFSLICINFLLLINSVDSRWQSCIYNGRESFYDKYKEACCQGRILRRASNLEEWCCGGQLFDSTTGECCGDHTWIDTSTHSCCGGRVNESSDHFECCNNQWIDTTTHTCCKGNIIEGAGKCCGSNSVFNPETEHCCLGPGDTGHVATVGRAAVVHGFLECCNTKVIDTRSTLCCQDNAIDQRTPSTECCGTEAFDTSTEVCCQQPNDYRISPLVDGKMECCGLTPYNKDTDQCCNSVITPNIGNGRCCFGNAYNPQQASCCRSGALSLSIPEIPGVQGCCSGVSYLKTQQVCCDNTLRDLEAGKECCGSDLYDPTVQLCCRGNIVDKLSPTSQCCGDSNTFEPEEQTCCCGHVTNIVNGSCCGTRAYRPEENKCCGKKKGDKCGNQLGRLYGKDAVCCGVKELGHNQLCSPCSRTPVTKLNSNHNSVCCVNKNPRNGWRRSRNGPTYDDTTEICRNLKIITKTVSGDQMHCGTEAYSPDTQQCCHLTVQPKFYLAEKPYRQKCCGSETYVPQWHTCYGERKYPFPEEFAGYCRGNVYNERTHGCDGDSFIRPLEELEHGLEVCINTEAENGYYPYDPAEKECCGGVLIGPGETCCDDRQYSTPGTGVGEGNCCGSEGFNPDTHKCCDRVLHEVTAQGRVCCGRELFDPSNPALMCCNSTLQSTVGDKTACTDGVAHRPYDTVCEGTVYPVENGECCGGLLMSSTKICCQGKFLYDKTMHGDTCCGRVAYDTLDETKKCCMDSLFHDAQDAVCCHSDLMDPSRQVCRAVGDVHYIFPKDARFFSAEGESIPAGHTVCQGLLYPFPGECCGNEVIRSSEDAICCDGVKKTHAYGDKAMCCSRDVMDSELYTCCGGKSLRRNHGWLTCCNGEPMGREKCKTSQQRLPPSNLEETRCGGQVYNASSQGCCNGQIYDPELHGCLDNLLRPLCGGVQHNNDTHLCCSGAAYDVATMGCCNGEPYELGKRTCCAERLYRMRNGSCCGDRPYKPSRHLCCGNTPRRKKKGRSQCCGGNAYDPEMDTCCEGNVTRGTRRGSCCGHRAFDPAQKVCCPKTGMLSRRREKMGDTSESCCELGMEYDKDAGTCLPQECMMCLDAKSPDGWKNHTRKLTLIRGTVSNITIVPFRHILQLTRVTHLNHNKRQSRQDSRELAVTLPAHCNCLQRLQLGRAYIFMSDADVTGDLVSGSLVLQPSDYLTKASDSLGLKIKLHLCRNS
ncbi:uncharacterized protein LOC110974261 isoform X2 [Acanthaster planci]|uniref:Uncharacterized protein LOC110974261 isoform X2 n=1 Tax=Acanthaster planci TaxID=133434 RepID=A0A8B7XN44_ACAPL|nr:uncharacterized protein LOC110974261 isoform X2 [Acanthaster planci]